MDYSKLTTPPVCVADFCLIPVSSARATTTNAAFGSQFRLSDDEAGN